MSDPVTPADIQVDIQKLRTSIRMSNRSIRGYREAIKAKHEEKTDLLVLVANPQIPDAPEGLAYDVVALKKNVNDCDVHIAEFERTIEKEERAIKVYEEMIETLEKDKWQLEQTFQLTGYPVQE